MRKAAISSGIPRLVVRFSSKYVYTQLAEAKVPGDRMLAAASSKELDELGWKASSQNTSAAFLTGLLLGRRALVAGIEEAILDIGLKKPSVGSKLFAVLKGAVDAGLQVPHGEDILPSEERINGGQIAMYAKQMLEDDPQRYERMFSQYLSRGLKPEDLVEHFQNVKDNVLNTIKSDEKA